ncbi:MAG: DNA repair protein RadC [Thermodesulfobacteriota bacterium]
MNDHAGQDRKGHRERLKDRFLASGAAGLSEEETLELLLSYAIPRQDVRPLSAELISRLGGLSEVLNASIVELTAVKGVSRHCAGLIRLVREVVTLVSERSRSGREVLKGPKELERYLLARLGSLKEETIFAIFLNSLGEILGEEFMGTGTINQVVLFPRQLMGTALRYNASGLVLVHNHPHGPPVPSARDAEQAEQIRDMLRPFDITLLDSVVVGHNRCFSIFRNRPL